MKPQRISASGQEPAAATVELLKAVRVVEDGKFRGVKFQARLMDIFDFDAVENLWGLTNVKKFLVWVNDCELILDEEEA